MDGKIYSLLISFLLRNMMKNSHSWMPAERQPKTLEILREEFAMPGFFAKPQVKFRSYGTARAR